MNWDAISAVGEVVGALGVIFSVLYLAVQVRSNTKATRKQNAHDHNVAARELWSLMASTSDIASIWRRGLVEPDTLNPDEKLRFTTMMHTGATLAEEDFYARREKDLPPWVNNVLSVGFYDIARTPGFALYFEYRKQWFSEEFRRKLESEMTKVDASSSIHGLYTGDE